MTFRIESHLAVEVVHKVKELSGCSGRYSSASSMLLDPNSDNSEQKLFSVTNSHCHIRRRLCVAVLRQSLLSSTNGDDAYERFLPGFWFSLYLVSLLLKMMSDSDNTASSSTPFQPIALQLAKAQRQYQQLLDRVTPFVLYRWLGTAGVLAIFMLRIVLSQGVSKIS